MTAMNPPPAVMFHPFVLPQLEDPHPVLALLREQSPVFFSELLGAWIIPRCEDILAVLRDTKFPACGAGPRNLSRNGLPCLLLDQAPQRERGSPPESEQVGRTLDASQEGDMDQPKRVEGEKTLYFVTSFLASVTLSYYLARLVGGGTPAWGFMFLPLAALVGGFWLFYGQAKRRPTTIYLMNAVFAFLSLIAVFLAFQYLSALRG